MISHTYICYEKIISYLSLNKLNFLPWGTFVWNFLEEQQQHSSYVGISTHFLHKQNVKGSFGSCASNKRKKQNVTILHRESRTESPMTKTPRTKSLTLPASKDAVSPSFIVHNPVHSVESTTKSPMTKAPMTKSPSDKIPHDKIPQRQNPPWQNSPREKFTCDKIPKIIWVPKIENDKIPCDKSPLWQNPPWQNPPGKKTYVTKSSKTNSPRQNPPNFMSPKNWEWQNTLWQNPPWFCRWWILSLGDFVMGDFDPFELSPHKKCACSPEYQRKWVKICLI